MKKMTSFPELTFELWNAHEYAILVHGKYSE